MTYTIAPSSVGKSTRLIAGLGSAWNMFGIVQFSGQALSTPAMLMDRGMTPAQAVLYSELPWWMTMAFGIGVFAGLAGSLLLFAGRRQATGLLGLSLAGYGVLFVGDITEGIFAAFGSSQVAVLIAVVAIAVGMLAVSVRAQSAGRFR